VAGEPIDPRLAQPGVQGDVSTFQPPSRTVAPGSPPAPLIGPNTIAAAQQIKGLTADGWDYRDLQDRTAVADLQSRYGFNQKAIARLRAATRRALGR
jgi:hypothetical protein